MHCIAYMHCIIVASLASTVVLSYCSYNYESHMDEANNDTRGRSKCLATLRMRRQRSAWRPQM